MPSTPSPTSVLLLLGLSLFFGLAFEDFHRADGKRPPGGIRTFPLLALAGGMLTLIDPDRLLPFSAGLLVLGAWLYGYYRVHLKERDADGAVDAELVVPVCNALAYLLGPVVLREPYWVAVGVTVAAVLLLTAREHLHSFARQIDLTEIVTAGKFLILTGIVLPLLPNEPVIPLTTVTPYQVWLALLAVCTLSYTSYLFQRYVAPPESSLWVAILGGLYSSTATTVVLARRAGADPLFKPVAQTAIILATAVMYLRILVIVAFFNLPLALGLAPPLFALSFIALLLAALQHRRAGSEVSGKGVALPRNPLELSTAAAFAALFVVISIATSLAKTRFGDTGVETLAAIVGITDIDPFVLNLAAGSGTPVSVGVAASAILIASASNNLLKAAYAITFAGRRGSLPGSAALVLLAASAVGAAIWTAHF
jgi:uncharacterized membrane protein (DUF4010 family)